MSQRNNYFSVELCTKIYRLIGSRTKEARACERTVTSLHAKQLFFYSKLTGTYRYLTLLLNRFLSRLILTFDVNVLQISKISISLRSREKV